MNQIKLHIVYIVAIYFVTVAQYLGPLKSFLKIG